MSVYLQNRDVTVCHGDCLDVLRTLPDESVDAVVTDPPYGIAFMGKQWDQPGRYGSRRRIGTPGKAHREGADGAGAMDAGRYDLSLHAMRSFQDWCQAWAAECLRVLKPGGHLLAFGGTRTWHRLTAGIEDAGFEIRDSIAWLHGQGFPKSLNLYGDHLGWGTALKPAFEPCVISRRPLAGTTQANSDAFGVGALNVEACRVPVERDGDKGRWPTNVVLDGAAAAALDAQSGQSVSRRGRPRASAAPGEGWGMTPTGSEYDDAGGASRFFPAFRWEPKAPASERPSVGGVHHPTVKPLALMRWLVRLVTPYGGVVLDPFAGSGTTVEAAMAEGMRCIAIEREAGYLPLICERISRAWEVPMDLWAGGSS